MAGHPKAKPITLRTKAGEPRVIDLYPADFAALRRINDGDQEVRHIEKEFRRLQARGLVRHEFVTGGDGFPKAMARLTADGEQAITLEHAAA